MAAVESFGSPKILFQPANSIVPLGITSDLWTPLRTTGIGGTFHHNHTLLCYYQLTFHLWRTTMRTTKFGWMGQPVGTR